MPDRLNRTRSRTSASQTSRLGHWLPAHHSDLNRWLKTTIETAEQKQAPFHPVIKEFQAMIESDPVMFMYFTQMFQQEPAFPPPPGSGDVKIQNYEQMLVVINHVLTTAPEFNTTGMVGFPINAILDFPMITPAGLAAFLAPKVNEMFRKVLKVWTGFLDSAGSLYVLNSTSDGWLSPDALKAIHMDDFIHDPKKPFFGFKSWNDFFIREFKPGVRPVAEPKNDKAIANACEAAPYAISANVSESDTFWIKAQPYSIRSVHQVEGTYYAEAASEGFDPAGPNDSQGVISQFAAGAIPQGENGSNSVNLDVNALLAIAK